MIVERLTRVISLNRVLDALEINLFLEHRYKGLFMLPKRGGKKNALGGVSFVPHLEIGLYLSVNRQH